MLSRCDTMAWVGWIVGALASLPLSGCAVTKLGATEADFARGKDQASQGSILFEQECAHCHGSRGEGLAGASAVLGHGALPEFPRPDPTPGGTMTDPQQIQIITQTRPAGAPWREPFRNAQDLNDFTSLHMPKDRAAVLKPDDYWAVVSFIVVAQGGQIPAGGINPTNARSIPIPKR